MSKDFYVNKSVNHMEMALNLPKSSITNKLQEIKQLHTCLLTNLSNCYIRDQPIKDIIGHYNSGTPCSLPAVSLHFNATVDLACTHCIVARTTNAQWSLFLLKSRTFGLEQTNWADKFWGIWGIFGRTVFLVQWVPCPCFPLFNHYFYKKLSLYIHIPNICLGLGFKFGPQRIRDLVHGLNDLPSWICIFIIGVVATHKSKLYASTKVFKNIIHIRSWGFKWYGNFGKIFISIPWMPQWIFGQVRPIINRNTSLMCISTLNWIFSHLSENLREDTW